MSEISNITIISDFYIHDRMGGMGKRITLVLDDDLITKLRKIQSEKIQKENRSVSFSEIVGEVLTKKLKK
ncbi:MAG: hypothetical protein K5777_08310 [Nitrosopumilus sp.]|nr:hypothetical protein [Nitrosopumilus sp.]